ncbi:MAG: nucleotidyl transferase AbiEii/AbiGii toxin family protein [Candidatus Microthrix subdominans]|jgi:hypothetical protein
MDCRGCDPERTLRSRIGGSDHTVDVNVTGLAGFLLAKTAAAHSRRKPKDWYDIAFVLLHNDVGGVPEAARLVVESFGDRVDVGAFVADRHPAEQHQLRRGPKEL